MPVIVVATFHPKPGRTDDVVAAVTSVIPEVHAEDGCELYALHREGDTLMMIEKWASRDALAIHGKGPALASLGPKLAGMMAAAPDVFRLDPVPTGEPDKGAL